MEIMANSNKFNWSELTHAAEYISDLRVDAGVMRRWRGP
ncbi:MAG: hypothetical protein KDB82_04655 [Planctomycetes bacterium]|nr:hypothetical protein [Planctomycetota bacterium]